MRTKEEVINQLRSGSTFPEANVNTGYIASNQKLIVEALLDIRDLLEEIRQATYQNGK